MFTQKEWKEKFKQKLKDKEIDWAEFNKNASVYLKGLFPDLQTGFDKVIPLIETLYGVRRLLARVKLHYKKLKDFHKLKLWYEWTYTKKELDEIIKKPKNKPIWAVEFNSKSGYQRFRKHLLQNNISFDKVHLKNAYHIKEADLLKHIGLLKRFQCKVY